MKKIRLPCGVLALVILATSANAETVTVLDTLGEWKLEKFTIGAGTGCLLIALPETFKTENIDAVFQIGISKHKDELRASTGLWVTKYKGKVTRDFLPMVSGAALLGGKPIKTKLIEQGDQIHFVDPIDLEKPKKLSVTYSFK
jgi:hypothetical protein